MLFLSLSTASPPIAFTALEPFLLLIRVPLALVPDPLSFFVPIQKVMVSSRALLPQVHLPLARTTAAAIYIITYPASLLLTAWLSHTLPIPLVFQLINPYLSIAPTPWDIQEQVILLVQDPLVEMHLWDSNSLTSLPDSPFASASAAPALNGLVLALTQACKKRQGG